MSIPGRPVSALGRPVNVLGCPVSEVPCHWPSLYDCFTQTTAMAETTTQIIAAHRATRHCRNLLSSSATSWWCREPWSAVDCTCSRWPKMMPVEAIVVT